MIGLRSILCGALLCAGATIADAQQGAAAIAGGVNGFAVSMRVLIVGAHPDDEDTGLIAWLARNQHAETAYLSLTRGDGGQNLIGHELGEALGAIRTEEMLAARRIDGGRQYFTRAFDFGYSKDSAETLQHWPREPMLGEVVSVIRAFRPHVIIAMFSGTAADGHGHHTVSALLARDAYEAASDTMRFPTEVHGGSWTPLKYYRALRSNAAPGALRFNVGAFDPVAGATVAELATHSRNQHKSQGQGRLFSDSVQWIYALREASRVNDSTSRDAETSLFDGIDTLWTRFAPANAAERAVVDSLPRLAAEARQHLDLRAPSSAVPFLARAVSLLERARGNARCSIAYFSYRCSQNAQDFATAMKIAHERARNALLAAAGVRIDAFADREYLAMGDTAVATLHIANRGPFPVRARILDTWSGVDRPDTTAFEVAPDSVGDLPRRIFGATDAGAAWWIDDRVGFDFFPDIEWPADGLLGPRTGLRGVPPVSGFTVAEDAKLPSAFDVRVEIAGAVFTHRVGPFQFRREDLVRGEVRRTMATVHAVSLLFDRTQELMRANEPVDRVIRLRVRSYSSRPRSIRLRFSIPPGLAAAELPDTMTLGPLEVRDISLHVTGKVTEERHPLTVYADEGRQRYVAGYFTIGYDHIRQIVLKRSSGLWVKGVRVAVEEDRRVVYVPGVADDVGAILGQLDVPVQIVEPERFGSFDLSPYQTVVLGPRVYSRFPGLVAYNARLAAFARQGGTVVVQYGQHEMAAPGMLPFPIELDARPQRVTLEQAPVRILDSLARRLRAPNVIAEQDFAGWTQERALYMPARVDSAWRQLFEMNDPDEPPNRNSVIIAPLGRGNYVYTTLSFFRQVPAGTDGAIRLFVNLLGSGSPGR